MRDRSAALAVWDPQLYWRFTKERDRAFSDLVARIGAAEPGHVVDLGCGPGNETEKLAERWPRSQVEGVDSSDEMLALAMARSIPVDPARQAYGPRVW